jgi:glycine cleavage system H lipoate-binding protein
MTPNILVIEPDRLRADAMKRLFSSEGYDVRIVAAAPASLGEGFTLAVGRADILTPGVIRAAAASVVLVDEGGAARTSETVLLVEPPHALPRVLDAVNKAVYRLAHLRRAALVREHALPAGAAGVDVAADGSWSRRLDDGTVELGLDARAWHAEGVPVSVELLGGERFEAGEPYARVMSPGRADRLLAAPVSGSVASRNAEASAGICVLMSGGVSEGWLMPLVRLRPG